MHYACIAPTAYLEQYAGRGHFQLCLAQVAMRDAGYFEWYRKRRELGDFVILDNGAYEGELVGARELIRVSEELQPNVLTIPDKINDADESQRLYDDFMREANGVKQFGWPAFMRVLQHESRDMDDWQELIDNIHDNWVALPRVLKEFRVEVAGYLNATKRSYQNVHAFGWTGNLNEVRQLAKLGVTSIDTSAPVWRGMHGVKLQDYVDGEWEHAGPKLDPSYPDIFPEDQPLIDSNLAAMQRACVAF